MRKSKVKMNEEMREKRSKCKRENNASIMEIKRI